MTVKIRPLYTWRYEYQQDHCCVHSWIRCLIFLAIFSAFHQLGIYLPVYIINHRESSAAARIYRLDQMAFQQVLRSVKRLVTIRRRAKLLVLYYYIVVAWNETTLMSCQDNDDSLVDSWVYGFTRLQVQTQSTSKWIAMRCINSPWI